MSLHPDIIDAMVAAGASAGMDPGAVLAMVQAACRAAWNVAQQVSPPPVAPVRRETPRDIADEMRSIAAAMHALDGDVKRDAPTVTASRNVTVTPSRSAMTGAERQKRYRDKRKVTVTASVTRNGSLSLFKKDLFNSEEREGESTVTPSRNVTHLVAMTPDWQPNEKAAQLARDELGDVGAANCLAKFRDHYESTGAQLTPAGWQAKFRKWVRSERSFAGGDQRVLPLARKVAEATGPPPWWHPGMLTDDELRKQWRTADG